MTNQKYCSKCGRPLINNHCPVHIENMTPLTENDKIEITIKEYNKLYKNKLGA